MKSIFTLWIMLMLSVSMIGCDDGGGDSSDADADADTDSDTDSDTDADGDCPTPDASECGGDWGVFDSGSCMCWEVPGSAAEYTWDEALAYCEGLALGGFSDWVLASRYDYQDMLGGCDERVSQDAMGYCQICADNPNCSAILGDDESIFWTSTMSDSVYAWYVQPYGGFVRAGEADIAESARCVRAVP